MTVARLMRVDLHVHSRHSGAGHLGIPGWTSAPARPAAIHRAARRGGMDLVTLTDIDTIDGCLEFLDAHPDADDFFISVETRARHPRTGRTLNVLLYDLSEEQHREAQRLKADVTELAAWIRSEGIVASLASLLDLLDHDGRTAVLSGSMDLFDRFEVRSGAQGRRGNELAARLVQQAAAAGRPIGATAGSGAHRPAGVGRVATVARAGNKDEFLTALRHLKTWAAGIPSGPWPRKTSLEDYLGRARLSVRVRRARRRLDTLEVLEFQKKARTFGKKAHNQAAPPTVVPVAPVSLEE